MSLTPKCDMFLESPCLPKDIQYLHEACVTSVISVLQVCYKCVMSMLQ